MSNHAGAVPDWMTQDYFQERIRTLYGKPTICLIRYEVTPGSMPGDNYLCQIFRIKMTYADGDQDKNLSIIGKLLPNTDMATKVVDTFDIHHVEMNMLTKTLPELSQKFPNLKPFFPKMLFLDEEHKIIYMEDLKERGFVMADRMNRLLDIEHARMVVQALATMHAYCFLLEDKNPGLKDMYRDTMWKKVEGGLTETMINTSIGSIMKVLDRWPIKEEQKEKIRRLESSMYDMLCDVYKRREDSFNVLLHGDCWVNNVLFKYGINNRLDEVVLVDYQMCNHNSIGLDLNYFLFMSTQVSVLTNHKDALLELYYQTFVKIAGDVPGFTLQLVQKEFLERQAMGFACFLLFRPAIVNPKPFDIDAMANGEADSNVDLYLNDKYTDELVMMLPIFEKSGVI